MSKSSCGLIQKPDEFLAAAGLLEFADGFGLDLPNPLASHFENVTYFLQSVAVAVAQTVPQLDDLSLPVTERLENPVDPLCRVVHTVRF